jgi:hypothetical protein
VNVSPPKSPPESIGGAVYSYAGQWPWHAALFHEDIGYICGATLISNMHLLTGEIAMNTQSEFFTFFLS